MPRRLRTTAAGYVCHVLNRAVGRMTIFEKAEDDEAFEGVVIETRSRLPDMELFLLLRDPFSALEKQRRSHWGLLFFANHVLLTKVKQEG